VRRLLIVIVLAVVAVAAVSACRQYLPTNRYLQPRKAQQASLSTADARRKFNHERHAKPLETAAITCADCHRFDAKIDAGDEALASALSNSAQYPGSSACHYCHGPGETKIATAPDTCTTCHDNLVPLLPANHQIAWTRVHASVASADPMSCQQCHRDAFCINCHQARDTISNWVHEDNFISFHGVVARANPMECGSCHREDFCINCHATARGR
jgi:cytochrome c553